MRMPTLPHYFQVPAVCSRQVPCHALSALPTQMRAFQMHDAIRMKVVPAIPANCHATRSGLVIVAHVEIGQ